MSPGAYTYSMSPANTLERPTTVNFGPSRVSIESAKLPNGPEVDAQEPRYRKGHPKETQSIRKTPGTTENWMSRWFGRKEEEEEDENTKEYP